LDDLRLNVPGPAPTPAQKATGTAGSAVAGSVAGPVNGSLADCLGTVVEFGQRWAGRWHYGTFQEGTIDFFGGSDSLLYGRVTTVGRFDKPLPGDPYRYAEARFVPLGTSEVIRGLIGNGTAEFIPDPAYFVALAGGGRSFVARPAAPAWLRDVYGPRRLAQARRWAADEARWAAARAERARVAAQAAYEAAHPPAPTYFNNPAQTRPADRAYQPTEHEVTCSSCGGSGWVSGQSHAYGQSVSTSYDGRSQCHTCGGRGKVTTKY